MFVPQTAVYQNNGPVLRENKVGAPRQGTVMKSVPETHAKQAFADGVLWLRIFSTNSGHAVATLVR